MFLTSSLDHLPLTFYPQLLDLDLDLLSFTSIQESLTFFLDLDLLSPARGVCGCAPGVGRGANLSPGRHRCPHPRLHAPTQRARAGGNGDVPVLSQGDFS
jgi:hypothetical protein